MKPRVSLETYRILFDRATHARGLVGPIHQEIEDWGQGDGYGGNDMLILRAWSNGMIEGRWIEVYDVDPHCFGIRDAADCSNLRGWFVISSPNEGLNAAADINFDERVDAADLGQLLAAWGDAPRNDYPPSDCPLGLIP